MYCFFTKIYFEDNELSWDSSFQKSNRIGEIIKLLNEKSDSWLELGEFDKKT